MSLFKGSMYLEFPPRPSRRLRGVDYAGHGGGYRGRYARRDRARPAAAVDDARDCTSCDCAALDPRGLPVCQLAVVGDTRILRDHAWAA